MTELAEKIKLESAFSGHLAALNTEMVSVFARNPQVPDFAVRAQEPLATLLLSHFHKTSQKFDDRISGKLPLTLQASNRERADIEFTLSQYFQKKAPEQARIILATTQRQAEEAGGLAQRIEMDPGLIPLVATGLFARSLLSRTKAIAVFETQAAAEASKMTEAEVLLGLSPSVRERSPAISSPIMRTWLHMGDAHVRSAHLSAGGQKAPMGSPFTVMGQELMFPGDTSLGATIDNTINCRCSIIYDTQGIGEARA